MERKYKFFIKDSSLTIIENEGNSCDLDQKEINVIVAAMIDQKLDQDQVISCSNFSDVEASIFEAMKVIKAAGGYVLNPQNELLMIYRRGFWDLPKGKLDKGETIEQCALREVEEECGVFGLSILSEAFHTYHLYTERNGKTVIKDSAWYKMTIDQDQALTPQTEEDIEQAIWQKLPVPQEMMSEAYGSIQDVIQHFD